MFGVGGQELAGGGDKGDRVVELFLGGIRGVDDSSFWVADDDVGVEANSYEVLERLFG